MAVESEHVINCSHKSLSLQAILFTDFFFFLYIIDDPAIEAVIKVFHITFSDCPLHLQPVGDWTIMKKEF